MNKKILIGCIGIVFMMVAITVVTAVSNEKNLEKKESPLFRIRNQRTAVMPEKIRAFFIQGRVFQQFQMPRNLEERSIKQQFGQKKTNNVNTCFTCRCTCQICSTVECTNCLACGFDRDSNNFEQIKIRQILNYKLETWEVKTCRSPTNNIILNSN